MRGRPFTVGWSRLSPNMWTYQRIDDRAASPHLGGMSSVTRLLQCLVSTPSVNPALPGEPDILGEHRMTALLDGWLAGCGFETKRVETVPGRPSLVATFGPD